MKPILHDYDSYINGQWKKTHRIPVDRGRWSTFDMLSEKIKGRLCYLCQTDKAMAPFYIKMLEPVIKISPAMNLMFVSIDGITTLQEFITLSWQFYKQDVQTFFGLDLTIEKGQNLPSFYQSGLGLPKSYYADKKIIRDYQIYIEKLSTAYGHPVDAAAVILFESRLAKLHLSPSAHRDVVQTHNLIKNTELPTFFQFFNLPLKDVIVDNLTLFQTLPSILQETPIKVLKDYLRYKVACDYALFQPKAIRAINFEFYGKRLHGQKKQQGKKMRALHLVQSFLPEQLEQLYIKSLPNLDHTRKKCLTMIFSIVDALKVSIKNSTWMTDSTKEKSLEKLYQLTIDVGYPKKWRDTTGLNLDPKCDIAVLNQERAAWYFEKHVLGEFYKPTDVAIWEMAVYEVNAYYDLSLNKVIIPAGILDRPFFGYTEDERNFGALGCIVGHELTHGFDDQGRKFNPQGELKKWWTESDIRAYEHRAAKVRTYYSEMKYMGLPINGGLTLGENLADVGGLKLSLRALGANPDYHTFFKAYAVLWRELIREKALRTSILSNPHAPDKLRINAVLSHIPEFFQTYGQQLSPQKIQQLNEFSIW